LAQQHAEASMLASNLCRSLCIESAGAPSERLPPSCSSTQHNEHVHATVSGMLASAWSSGQQQQPLGSAGFSGRRLLHPVFSSSIEDGDNGSTGRGTSASGSQARNSVPSSKRKAYATPHAFRGDSSGFYTAAAAAANGTLLRPSTSSAGPQQTSNGYSSTNSSGASVYDSTDETAATQGLRIEQQDERRNRVAPNDGAPMQQQQQGGSNSGRHPPAQPPAPTMAIQNSSSNTRNGAAPGGPQLADQGSTPLQPAMQAAGGEGDPSSSTRRRRGLLQRPERGLSAPPEPPQGGWQGPPTTPKPSSLPLSPAAVVASYRRRSGQEFDDDDEYGYEEDDSEVELRPPQPRRPPPQPRIARALPLQLIPMSPGAGTLLDPDTGRPLVGDSSTSSSTNTASSSSRGAPASGVALPLLGPWVLSNSRDKFPASDALVDYHPGSRHGIQQWLSMRLEYVPQSDEPESEYEGQIGDAVTLPSQGFSGTPASSGWEGEGDGEGEFGPSWEPYSRPVRPDPIATLQLFNLSRRRRGSAEAATFFVYSPASEEEGRGRTQAAIRPGDPGFPLRPGDVITFGSQPNAPRFR
jgi:hypothetical protein